MLHRDRRSGRPATARRRRQRAACSARRAARMRLSPSPAATARKCSISADVAGGEAVERARVRRVVRLDADRVEEPKRRAGVEPRGARCPSSRSPRSARPRRGRPRASPRAARTPRRRAGARARRCRRRRTARRSRSSAPRPRRRPTATSEAVTQRIMSKSWISWSRNIPPERATYSSPGGSWSCEATCSVCTRPSSPPDDQAAQRLQRRVEPAHEPDLDTAPDCLDLADEVDRLVQLARERLLAEARDPAIDRAPDEPGVRRAWVRR